MAVSRLEQAGYPFDEGLRGISFAGIPVETTQIITSGSGRQLYCVMSRDRISVFDLEEQLFGLAAAVNHQTITFNLQTRSDSGGEKIVHPDLFGAKFVAMALANFESRGNEIIRYLSKWHPDSVNYEKFQAAKATSGDVALAAKSTWGGKIAATHGFTEFNLEDYLEDEDDGDRYVRVIFRRPK